MKPAAKPSLASKEPPSDASRSQRPFAADTLLVHRHLRIGWWGLLVFLTLGMVLEALHGFKVGYYLDVSNHTRRLMWTLAHAHGTLLGLLQVAFAATLKYAPSWENRQRDLASVCLMSAGILIPIGFFLGSLVVHAGDPGLGIVLVPIGAILLLMAGILTIRGLRFPKNRKTDASP